MERQTYSNTQSKENAVLIIGIMDSSIKKAIRVLKDIGREDEEIYLSITALVKLQKDIIRENEILNKEIGINLLLNKEDYQEYISLIEAQDCF